MSKLRTTLKKESNSFEEEPKAQPWIPNLSDKIGVKYLLHQNAAGLLLDPGMHKTSISLKAFCVLKAEGIAKRALVIAPLRPVYRVWPEEVKKWAEFNHLRVAILHDKDKDKAIAGDADLYVMNPEGLPWLMSEGRFKKLNADTLIVDESSKFKHTKTQRFKQLKPVLTSFKRRWILTGSPNANGYENLFGQVYILDLGNALGQYITQYRFTYFFPTGYGGYTWKLKSGADKAIQEKLKPLCLRLEAEDYIKMPKLIPNVIRVDLPAKARKTYDDLEEELFAKIDEGEVSAVNAAAASMKCSQVANGGLYYHDNAGDGIQLVGDRKTAHIHDAKTEALRDLVNELNHSPLLVGYEFNHDLERLQAEFGKDLPYIGSGVSMKRLAEIERAWNAGDIPLLAGHPASMGHGLNLQGAARHVAWYSITWDYELYDQFIRRVRRSGNKFSSVFVHHFVARNTVDEAKMRAINRKAKGQMGFLDAMKDYRNRRKQA